MKPVRLAGLARSEREAIIAQWYEAKRLLVPVLMLPQVALVDDHPLYATTAALDGAIVAYRQGELSDDDFGAMLTGVIVAVGDVVTEDGELVMDRDDADGQTVRAFLDALPNIAGKVTVTGAQVTDFDAAPIVARSAPQKKGVPTWAWVVSGLVIVAAVAASRKKRR